MYVQKRVTLLHCNYQMYIDVNLNGLTSKLNLYKVFIRVQKRGALLSCMNQVYIDVYKNGLHF
jgi:hypothetical protein